MIWKPSASHVTRFWGIISCVDNKDSPHTKIKGKTEWRNSSPNDTTSFYFWMAYDATSSCCYRRYIYRYLSQRQVVCIWTVGAGGPKLPYLVRTLTYVKRASKFACHVLGCYAHSISQVARRDEKGPRVKTEWVMSILSIGNFLFLVCLSADWYYGFIPQV